MARKKTKRKKKEKTLLKNYKESWSYIKESRNFVYMVMGVFFLFVMAGALLPVPEDVRLRFIEIITELMKKTEGMSMPELTGFLFLNNVQSSFFGIIFGIALGIFSVFSAISNGYLVGFVASLTVKSENAFVLWRLLPHGIFELPALFLSLGMGLKLGSFIFQKEKAKALGEYMFGSLKVFIFIIVPLLIIAAVIEASLIAISGGS